MTTKSTLTAIALVGVFMTSAIPVSAKDEAPKKVIARSVSYSVPSGYTQLGNTDLFYRQTSNSVDFIGRFNSSYYSSTYSDNGYKLAIKVGDNSATNVDCLYGTTVNGVSCTVSIIPQGELGRVVYTVSNTKDTDISVSLGTHADVMIGSNDSAPISRRIDTIGNTYGLTMRDGNGAQLCVLFGAGLVGVNSVSDFWFGRYSLNSSAYEMVGNYSSGSNYMQENGSYDSGMGWCWKDRTIPANSSVEFSYLIGVGDVNLEPNSSFEVTPEDPEGWNDLSRPHMLTLEGEYESPAGQNGRIEYAVEDSEEWQALTEELESGSSFTGTLIAMFNQDLSTHTIRFRTVDAVGNTSMLTPIIYKDVRFVNLQGIENKTYNWGDSITQPSLSCDLDISQYEIAFYRNNVNAGTASFNIEGVFPYTIGRKTYNFDIAPLNLPGSIDIVDNAFVYNGASHTPEWSFNDNRLTEAVLNRDYTVQWNNNTLPGTASLIVRGINNFSGELKAEFFIDKAQLNNSLYTITLPNADITYDGNGHGASIIKSNGVGNVHFYYSSVDYASSEVQPSNVGTYNISMSIDEGSLYYGKDAESIGSFSIYQFDEADWNTLQMVAASLAQKGWSSPWNLSGGIVTASSLDGLKIEEGKIIGLDLSNQSLTGTFPIELLNFANLTELNISNNRFDGELNAIALMALQNPSMFSHCTKLNISNNGFEGNIGAFAGAFSSLTTLDASSNHLSDVYPMISPSVSELNLGGQRINKIVDIDLSNMSAETLAHQIPTILVYNHNAQNYSNPLSLDCTAQNGWKVRISYNNGELNMTQLSSDNAYKGASGDVLDVTTLSNDNNLNNTLNLRLSFDQGDSNFNGNIDILDLQTTIAYAFEEYQNRPFNFTAANLWLDDIINVQDAVKMVELLLNSSQETKQSVSRRNISRVAASTDASIRLTGNQLVITSHTPVAAFDITLSNCTSHDLDLINSYGLMYNTKQSENGLRIIGYSLNGSTLPCGEVFIGSVISSGIENAMLSDSDANAISVTASDITTGINDVEYNEGFIHDGYSIHFYESSSSKSVEWYIYNMEGCVVKSGNVEKANDTFIIDVEEVPHGIYILNAKTDNGKLITKKLTL